MSANNEMQFFEKAVQTQKRNGVYLYALAKALRENLITKEWLMDAMADYGYTRQYIGRTSRKIDNLKNSTQ